MATFMALHMILDHTLIALNLSHVIVTSPTKIELNNDQTEIMNE